MRKGEIERGRERKRGSSVVISIPACHSSGLGFEPWQGNDKFKVSENALVVIESSVVLLVVLESSYAVVLSVILESSVEPSLDCRTRRPGMFLKDIAKPSAKPLQLK